MNDKIVVLHISSFVGISPGAIHYYGSLNSRSKTIELKYILTDKTAELLSKKDYCYKAGMKTERFSSEKDIRRVARREWKKNFPDSIVLLEGSSSCVDPQKCLNGSKELKGEINRLWRMGEKIGGYEGDEKEMTKISDEYMNLLKKNKLWV